MRVSFTASASMSVEPDAIPSRIALPAVDASNPDLVVQNRSPRACWVAFGEGAGVTPNAHGTVTIPGSASVLLTEKAVVLTECVTNPLVQSASDGCYGTCTVAMVQALQRGGMLTFSRGTASLVEVF